VTDSSADPPHGRRPWWRSVPATIVGLVGVIAGVVTVIGFLQGDERGSEQPTQTTTSRSGPESFHGEVGDLEEGEKFLKFVFDHDGEIVRLDLQLTTPDVHAGGGGVRPYWRIWNDCKGDRCLRSLLNNAA
jgi:hypothetical protein